MFKPAHQSRVFGDPRHINQLEIRKPQITVHPVHTIAYIRT